MVDAVVLFVVMLPMIFTVAVIVGVLLFLGRRAGLGRRWLAVGAVVVALVVAPFAYVAEGRRLSGYVLHVQIAGELAHRCGVAHGLRVYLDHRDGIYGIHDGAILAARTVGGEEQYYHVTCDSLPPDEDR